MTDGNSDKEGNGFADWVKKGVAPLVTLGALVTALFTGFFWLESHYAKAEQLAQLEQRFEIKVTNDFLRETITRIWQLEDRLQERPDDLTAKEELRKLKEDKAKLERDLVNLESRP
jgi:hypothetical protein